MENGVDSVGRPLAEEETLTADGGISQLKLVDNVVQVFHERNVSEGDDVFEEAIDGNPEETPHAEDHQRKTDLDEAIVNGDEIVEKKSGLNLLEVNGSPNGDHTSEMFEEAIVELVSPSLDTSSEVGQSIVDDDKMQPLVVPDSVGEVTAKELVAAEVRVEDSEKDFEVAESVAEVRVAEPVAEVRVAEPVAEVRVAEPVTDVHDAGVVDEHIYQNDILPEEQIDSLTSSIEEEVKEVAEVIENGETKAFNDVREDTNGSYDVSTHETSEAIDVDEVKHGEKSTAPGVADLSPGNETSEQIICEDDQNWESKDTVACEDTSANEEEVSETKNISTNLTSSVNEKTWDEGVINPVAVEAIPTDIDQSVDAKVESDSEDVQDHSSGTHSVDQNDEVVGHISSVVQADEPERQTEEEKQDSVINDLGVTSMTRETESPVLIEDVLEKQIEQEKQDSLINNLGVTSLTRETESPVLVEDIQENETENEQEEQRRLIEGFTTKEMESLVRALEERETRNEQEKHDPEIAEVGESVDKETTQSVVEGPPKIHERETKQEKKITEVERESQPAVDPSPPPSRPAGLGGAAPLLEPTRVAQQSRVNGALPQRQTQIVEDTTNGETEENDETREKLQMIRVKFLRLARRLGQTPHNVVVAQVLYRLGLAEQLRGRNAGRVGGFSFDRASAMAEQLEAAGQEPLDFSCTIMVLGKTGVGKSATINSIFDEVKFSTDAFQMGTNKVQDVVGTVQGIKVRVIDTPGLLPCWSDQRQNEKILHSVKRFIKKNPPDIVLYLDRLDMQSRDFGDMPLLRTITDIFGPSIWFNAIVVLTHAASAPPDGPNGTASSYEMFVTQRSHVVQQAIRQAAGDMRLMNPVSLVENHSACRTNRAGQRVLPNGQVWKPHLLLLSFASKILAEANTLLKLQDNPPGKPFATRSRVPPLPFLLSSLLQSRPQVKLPEEQYGDEDGMDEELDDSSDSDDESEYDELPPFKSLTKVQLAKLDKAQKKAYFDELEYREKLFMKKQLKDEKKRRKLLKKMEASAKDLPNDYNENAEEDSGAAASVPVAMPDFALPTSFDSDNPTHRYRFLDTSNQWLVRPVLETHGWDHDVGYEGINVERLFVIKEKIPLSFSGQVTKDKKESNLQMELAGSVKHGEGKATSLGFDMQTIGKDMAYTLRSDTRFSNYRHNQSAAGLSVTLLGDALTAGVKLEDRLIVNKRFRLVMTGGAMTGRGDVAYGGSLEATLRDKDHPLGRTLSTLGLSVMDWHGDLAIGCNIQSQIPVGRTTNLIARANLNNRGTGQVSIRLNSSEQLQIALIGLLPLIRKVVGHYQQMVKGEE